MNKFLIASFTLATILSVGIKSFSQSNSPILFSVASENITLKDFETVYKKNNFKDTIVTIKSLENHLDLYVNFKLKVKEAESLKLDTNPSFKKELSGYRKQLAEPYLTDKSVTEALLKEAYDRKKSDLRVAHILVRVGSDASPKDTLEAYNKIMKIREKVTKGINFEKTAEKESDDNSAKYNNGVLRYFTVFHMVYPFETMAYNTKVGEISMPVRTRFGYHILKVIDKRPALGRIHTAHIMVKINKDATEEDLKKAKEHIQDIYSKIKAGQNFALVAKEFSDDKASGAKGGELPWFGTGEMVPEYEIAAYNLKNNDDISEPVKTDYGWHIIRRIEKIGVGSFDDVKSELRQKVEKDSRSNKSKESFINKLKLAYNFKENLKAKSALTAVMDSSIFSGKWKAEKASKLNKELFKFANSSFSQIDFAKYIEINQANIQKTSFSNVIDKFYNDYSEKSLVDYEDARLETKYPEFKNLMKEYRDGILLFELTDKKVWSKAIKDTAGLEKFYQANKAKYPSEKSVIASIYICTTKANADKTKNLITKGKLDDSDILNEINADGKLNVSIENNTYHKNENEFLDKTEWKTGISEIKDKDKFAVIKIKEVIEGKSKSLDEARGLVIADYQNFLEKEWINKLKTVYPVVLHKEVLSQLIKN